MTIQCRFLPIISLNVSRYLTYMNQQIFNNSTLCRKKINDQYIGPNFFCLVHIQRWGCGIRHQFFYAHNIFSSVIIFLLDFIGGTKALWYCDILTHICSWFTYFFFHSFSYHKSGITLSNILFFCLPFSEKREKRIKENIFSVHSFHLFLYVCISYRFTCSTYSPHVYIIDFWSAFYEVLSLRFFFRLFLFLNFSFHYRLFFW